MLKRALIPIMHSGPGSESPLNLPIISLRLSLRSYVQMVFSSVGECCFFIKKKEPRDMGI
jgi:hypothetical protein